MDIIAEKPKPMTHEERQKLIRAKITRGILAETRQSGQTVSGCSMSGALREPVLGRNGRVVGYHMRRPAARER